MSNFNKVILIGNLGQEPEIMDFGEGRVKASFPLATNEHYTTKSGEKSQRTEWHNIVAWGKKAEFIKSYCTKGTKLLIEGKIASRSYETKDGEKRRIYEILANSVEILSNKAVAEPF